GGGDRHREGGGRKRQASGEAPTRGDEPLPHHRFHGDEDRLASGRRMSVETKTTHVAKPARAMISSQRISRRVKELGQQISETYADIDTPLVMIVILKGATVFAADLLRSLAIPAEL